MTDDLEALALRVKEIADLHIGDEAYRPLMEAVAIIRDYADMPHGNRERFEELSRRLLNGSASIPG